MNTNAQELLEASNEKWLPLNNPVTAMVVLAGIGGFLNCSRV
jgi:hypothetical protein